MYDTDKIGFVGVNGAGKSTLFKMIAGMMDFDSGDLSKSKDARIGYPEQYPVSDGNISIMDDMLTAFSEVVEIEEQLAQIHIDLESQSGDMDALVSRQAARQEHFMELDGTYTTNQK